MIRIRAMSDSDAPDMVHIHLAAFPSFFLTSLGAEFLAAFYGAFAGRADTIALIAEDERGGVVGFATGANPATGYYSRLIRDRAPRLVAASLGALLRRPALAIGVVRRMSADRGALLPSTTASLLSIAVLPDRQSGGVGKALVEAFVSEAARMGATGVTLTTDAVGNDEVNRFYERRGFRLVSTFVAPEGRPMNEYLLATTCVQAG